MNVHFICRGNVFRSIIAEAYLESQNIAGLAVISSGTLVSQATDKEAEFLASTLELLERHDVAAYAKRKSDMLSSARMQGQDVTVCMNQIVFDEASAITKLPANTQVWDITDIGEGDRVIGNKSRAELEEIVYAEVTAKVDSLIAAELH